MSEDLAWLTDRNGWFRNNLNLLGNIIFLLLALLFIADYDAAKNSYQFNQAMHEIRNCQNYTYVYLILGHTPIDQALNASPLILGYTCTNGLSQQFPTFKVNQTNALVQ